MNLTGCWGWRKRVCARTLRVISVIFPNPSLGFYRSIYHLCALLIYRHFSIDKQSDVNVLVHIFVDCSFGPAFNAPPQPRGKTTYPTT